jgi:hypothetical protein
MEKERPQKAIRALAESGGIGGAAVMGLRAVLDPDGAAKSIMENNKPRPR